MLSSNSFELEGCVMKIKIPLLIMSVLVFVIAINVNRTASHMEKPVGSEEMFLEQRIDMVDEQIISRGVKHPQVIEAMREVERHRFVPLNYQGRAYMDGPLSIGMGQTISQPYIVAYMTEMAEPSKTDKVLEIGTGSGYQAAVIAEIVDSVYTIEILESLGQEARSVLTGMGFENIHFRIGDGYMGWPEEAPFDIIIVTAAPEIVPDALIEQLASGGRMIVPVGPQFDIQYLLKITKDDSGNLHTETLIPVRFVPMVEGDQ
jgi:protein-L-isoaspartate(D-aspartate) O-methyltransferase